MTRAEAITEALRRWPGTGHIFDRDVDSATARRLVQDRYWVGSSATGTVFPHIYGNGNSWEEAFAAAEGKSLEEAFDPKMTPKQAYDKLTRISDYLDTTCRDTGIIERVHRRMILNNAQQIVRLEVQMRGDGDRELC